MRVKSIWLVYVAYICAVLNLQLFNLGFVILNLQFTIDVFAQSRSIKVSLLTSIKLGLMD